MRENASNGTGRPPGRPAMPPENRFAIAAGAVALVAGIAFVSLVFLIVGQSEESDRRRHPRG